MSSTLEQSSMALLVAAIVSCYLVIETEQIPPKWFKPYAWDGPVKYSRLSYKPQTLKSLPPPSHLHSSQHHALGYNKLLKTDNNCQLRKVIFTQDAESPQYIVFKSKIPDLKEFTLCHWHNLFNYTHDQPIFSYTHSGMSRVIYSWIENTPDKTYYSLAINGHTIYRINYPEKLFKWYHVCQSWNGHTGEWQLWINTERVARGFYNLMVGKMIKGGGVAISGREYLEQAFAVHHPAFSGELTLVALYRAALTAGKAYNDHKHHPVHNFHHGYDEAVDEADEADAQPDAPAGPDPTPHPHLAHGGPFSNGQLVPKLPVVPTVAAASDAFDTADDGPRPPSYVEHQLFDGGLYDFYGPSVRGGQLQDADFARQPPSAADADETFRVNLLDGVLPGGGGDSGDRYKRNVTAAAKSDRPWRRWSARTTGGAAARTTRASHREAAEWEVAKVSAVCSGCDADPFGTATVISWHDTRKQFYNGALYLPALPKCYLF